MSADKEAIARRAVVAWQKCGLGWMPGMSDDEYRVNEVTADDEEGPATLHIVSLESGMDDWVSPRAMCRPNLEDHATLGCIEHGMLPAAWPDGYRFTVSTDSTGACVTVCNERGEFVREFIRDTLGEALVACLEAAAERRRP